MDQLKLECCDILKTVRILVSNSLKNGYQTIRLTYICIKSFIILQQYRRNFYLRILNNKKYHHKIRIFTLNRQKTFWNLVKIIKFKYEKVFKAKYLNFL